MSVPLSKLYNFLQAVCKRNILIYRYLPHGSRNLTDCKPLDLYTEHQLASCPVAIFHDQEPIDVENFHLHPDLKNYKHPKILRKITGTWYSIYHDYIVVHSQKNHDMKFLEFFNAHPVYYWCHALIALDWFRYAAVDPDISRPNTFKSKIFLIYNRAWTGTREYRLKFLELVTEQKLVSFCQSSFAPYDNNQHFSQHCFKNPKLTTSYDLEKFWPLNTNDSNASADYNINDYLETDIEVVLETVFDVDYWHLTEKILRPIALAKPFILASAPGSLEYLRSYGFKTFSPWINESYDSIVDPLDRLQAIVALMKQITDMPLHQRTIILEHCQSIAEFNRAHFFSKEFQQQIVGEFESNIAIALNKITSMSNP
jgi:hypothetical protein